MRHILANILQLLFLWKPQHHSCRDHSPWAIPGLFTEYSEETEPDYPCPKQDSSKQAVCALWLPIGPAEIIRAMLWSEAHPAHFSSLLSLLSQVSDLHCGPKAFPPYCCFLSFQFFTGISPANLLHISLSVGICFSEAMNYCNTCIESRN